MRAYDESYLADAMKNLGEMLDYAVNDLNYSLNTFLDMFIASSLAGQFEKGSPKVVAGMSGKEIAFRVLEETGVEHGFDMVFREDQVKYLPSREYWCGWILAYYQWFQARSFDTILQYISGEEIVEKYQTLHEASEKRCVDAINGIITEKIKAAGWPSRLQYQRRIAGLSQSELAMRAGVNIRTLQQYETRAKDLSKASAQTVMSLAWILGCDPERILEFDFTAGE